MPSTTKRSSLPRCSGVGLPRCTSARSLARAAVTNASASDVMGRCRIRVTRGAASVACMVIAHPCTIDAAWPNFRHQALIGADPRRRSEAGEQGHDASWRSRTQARGQRARRNGRSLRSVAGVAAAPRRHCSNAASLVRGLRRSCRISSAKRSSRGVARKWEAALGTCAQVSTRAGWAASDRLENYRFARALETRLPMLVDERDSQVGCYLIALFDVITVCDMEIGYE